MENNRLWINEGLKIHNFDDEINNLGLSPIIIKLLINRGITNASDAQKFLFYDLSMMEDPFLLPDMKKAVGMISSAVNEHKKITIYGDYDADGVTSTSILYKCLKSIGANVSFYIPNRIDEGYGLNMDSVGTIIQDGTDLIITVDCGITSIEEARYCRENGVEIVITDHHECKDIIPDTVVINPKRHDSNYPFKDLSGAGIAFKLVHALSFMYGAVDYKDYLELAAIGTVADVVPVTGENRIIIKYGLEKIRNTKNVGIRAILNSLQLENDSLSSDKISFIIAPRINALGRLSSAAQGVELFTTDDDEKAKSLAGVLNNLNAERQIIEGKILKEAEDKISNEYNHQTDSAIILESPDWHMGVVGIVASKIAEKYYRPVIIFAKEGENLKGSGRSIPDFNLFQGLSLCQNLISKFGGHEQAAGLTIKVEDFQKFKAKFNEVAKSLINGKLLVPKLSIDCEMKEEDINYKLIEDINSLQPFGIGNPFPLFKYKGLIIEEIRAVGVSSKHLKLKLRDKDKTFDAIGFNMGYNINVFKRNDIVDIACSPEICSYNGNTYIQLNFKDIKKNSFYPIEDDIYNNLKKVIEKLSVSDDNSKVSFDGLKIIEGPINRTINEVSGKKEKWAIFVNNAYIMEELLDYNVDVFTGNQKYTGGNICVFINPGIDKILEYGAHNILFMDYLSWFDNIFTDSTKYKDINWFFYDFNVDDDIKFINSIKPDRNAFERVYIYLRKFYMNGINIINIKRLAEDLDLKKITAYYCIKAFSEVNILSVLPLKNGDVSFKLNKTQKVDLENSPTLIKFDILIKKLYKYAAALRGNIYGY